MRVRMSPFFANFALRKDTTLLEIPKNIAILGSTGSIGTQAIDIIAENPGLMRASLLTARRNWELLARQALRLHPDKVVIADDACYNPLFEALSGSGIEVASGAEAIADACADPTHDIVLTAMVGYSGLEPTIRAIKAGKIIALANKETLVAGGELITRMLSSSTSKIIPVDSEHSAIFQCLQGEHRPELNKIILTASGGPFRKFSKEQLKNVTPADALKHPNWNMGAKVTIDSASMMNKGFEMIEARWLFDVTPGQIEIAVHPQSIVHSMVEFRDGAVKAQLGVPDMHLPIAYALSYPARLPSARPKLTLEQYSSLTFERPDMDKFPLLATAFEAIAAGGTIPCIMNAANEIAVAAFLRGELRFTDMPRLVNATIERVASVCEPEYADIITADSEARVKACELLLSFKL